MESVNGAGGENPSSFNKEEASLSFEDALLELKIVEATELQSALKEVLAKVTKPKDLPAALIDQGVITRDQAREAFFLQLARRYANTFPGFEITATLGQGAVGTVFRATQARLEREVAIKVLDEQMARNTEVRKAFLSEARAAVSLSHPNIVQGYEVIEHDDICAFVMELVEGRTVDALVNARGPMEERQALNIVRDIARAFEHAEESGIVHRDVKPANLIVGRNRVAKLLDMGLAKVVVGPGSNESDNGMAVGTPNYMSPEQIRGEKKIDSRADIYSLGATLFFMMTGQTPFDGKPEVVMYKHIHEPPASPKNLRPECSTSIANLIFFMMAKDPEHRPSTATALIEAIDDALSNAGKAVAPAPPMILPTPPLAEPDIALPSRKRGKGRRGRAQKAIVSPAPIAEAPERIDTTPDAKSTPKAIPMPDALSDTPQPKAIPMPDALSDTPQPKAIPMPEALTDGPQPISQPEPQKNPAPKRRRRRNMR